MKPKNDGPAAEWGLAANGSSRTWDVAVEESLDRNEWSMEIEGPQAYLVFRLRDPEVVSEAARFLRSTPATGGGGSRRGDGEGLLLGRFDSAPVSLVRDDEDFIRCFLVVGPQDGCSLRFGLDAEDVQMLVEALNQALGDMAQTGRG